MTAPRILVAGIGNIFLGDDAFGVEVARQLAGRILPEGVRVVDFGIRGFDLAYALLDGDKQAILVDAMPRGQAPGTLYVLEHELTAADGAAAPEAAVEPHGMDPVKVLRLVQALGGKPQRLLVVGCEPESFGEEEDGRMGLSAPVQQAVPEAVALIERLINQIGEGQGLAPVAGDVVSV